ncbi:hypothetical protein ACIPJF_19315 [Streptomyces kanasensis]|uniref:hypothetical protein n=1 Tax=Streptomyces kanasensis TaxID=936756 RepID=UPI0037FE10B1
MHALRHFHASVFPDAGENIKALAEYPAYRARSAVAVLQSAGAGAEWRQEPEPGERTAPSP